MRARVTLTHAPALLVTGAVVASLSFHGYQVEFLAATQALLLAWGGMALWQRYEQIRVPATALAVSLALFWAWLGVSLLWTQVPAIGALNFWWMGSLPLAFWLYALSREDRMLWRNAAVSMLCLGVALALYAVFQLLVLRQPPRSVFININSHAALLNLLALPLLGYFLIIAARSRTVAGVLSASLFLLVYALAITQGRGAIAAFAVAVAFFFWVARAHIERKRALQALALIAVAFVLGNISSHGALMTRLESLSNPTSAGATRLVIWQQAWAMLQEQPWWGRGLGTFSLAYPPYRLPDDSSAGAFVHNDYLQLGIELGLPGLALFCAIWASLALLLWRARRRALPGAVRVEIAALTAGLVAITLHSVVDFNFYQVPILLIVGLVLARLHSLVVPPEHDRIVRPAAVLSRPGYRFLILAALALPLVYFSATSAAAYVYRQALALAERGDLAQADQAFARAMRLSPAGDNIAISRADLYRHALRVFSDQPRAERERLYRDALGWLERAETDNPLRPLVFVTRGRLYAENPGFAGDDWRALATENYRTALRVDPRFYAARVAYAALLLDAGDTTGARAVLEAGMSHWYLEYEAIVPYYALTAKLRREAGDIVGAAALEERIKTAMMASGWRWVPRAGGAPVLVSDANPTP